MDSPAEEKIEAVEGVLIIANRPKHYESAANFLSRRGHPCSVVSGIRTALKTIGEKKPAYVFLSWNLKGAHVSKSYQLLTKSFGVLVIVFAENTDSKTAAELASSGLPETMQAPVSGPGIYMKMQRVKKAREDAQIAADAQTNAAAQPQAQKIDANEVPGEGTWEAAGEDKKTGKKVWRFKADTPSSKTPSVITFKGTRPPVKGPSGRWQKQDDEYGSEFEAQATAAPSKAMGAASGRPKSAGGTISDAPEKPMSDAELEALINQMADSGDVTENKGAEEEPDYGSIMKLGQKKKESTGGKISTKPSEDESDLLTFGGPNKKSTDHILKQEGPAANEYEAKTEGAKGGDYHFAQTGAKAKDFEVRSHSAQAQGTNFKASRTTPAPQIGGRNHGSVLAQSTRQALEESVQKTNEDVFEIGTVTDAKVFLIKSSRFEGYLVATSAATDPFDPEVFEKLKRNIAQNLSQNGEALSGFEALDCKIEAVDFKKWSEKEAEFLTTAGHKKDQYGLAFFEIKGPGPTVEAMDDQKMLAVDIEDVLPEAKIPFDLFLYLPVNGKHFLYVKNGQKLSTTQRDRMVQQKVTRFFIKPTELKVFKEFCVANRLNAKIVVFEKEAAGAARAS